MKIFHFDNGTSKNIFSHPYFYYMTSESLQGQKQFHSRNYLLEMFKFHEFKSAPQKLNFLKAKNISQNLVHQIIAANALARSRIV